MWSLLLSLRVNEFSGFHESKYTCMFRLIIDSKFPQGVRVSVCCDGLITPMEAFEMEMSLKESVVEL